ncbi:hypothetical protein MW7_007240 [Imbroritus primus]|uniref:Uncharacterized protein n=1 Tax=Imbroritus primus TaxID=3058603 RepID=A0ACD3SS08_9BURK|nr:hypothetical protein MW7_007240 [Burkholderiaceae bacterium PBA]
MRRVPLKRTGFQRKAAKPKVFALALQRASQLRRSRGKAANTAEKTYLGKVAELGCVLCRHLGLGATPAIVHHQRTGQGKMRASHYRTAPLCPFHHQGSGHGVHDMGRPQFQDTYGISEVELVEQTRRELAAYLPATERALLGELA